MKEQIELSKLQMLIRDSIVLSMPDNYWVSAEISEMKVNYSGHCYLELIEKSRTGDNIKARARATIWAARYRSLKPVFESATGQDLRKGMKILVRVTVEYHELYGLSLNVNDIDPAYTLGDIAIKRQEIIRRLTSDGVMDMNRSLPMPLLPKRIAVISSATAAGYEDFRKQLLNNSFRYGYATELFNSPMQGSETSKGIISALNRIASRITEFDLVVILRGGGSTADLQWFDNYEAAFHITQFPIPVLTGIGHDKDISVIDMVAWQSLKTPTATASFLIEITGDTDSLVDEYNRRLQQVASSMIREGSSKTIEAARKIVPVTIKITGIAAKRVNSLGMSLSSSTTNRIKGLGIQLGVKNSTLKSTSLRITNTENRSLVDRMGKLKKQTTNLFKTRYERIVTVENLIAVASPDNILRKGFSLTTHNGKTVYSAREITEGDIITTRFADGHSHSRVEKREIN